MQTNRQELVRSARRRIQRGRKTTGRIVASAFGFGVAYYFDAEKDALRRKRFQYAVRTAVRDAVSVLAAPDVGDPPVVFRPAYKGGRVRGIVSSGERRVEAVR
jgi:hypothetical protein